MTSVTITITHHASQAILSALAKETDNTVSIHLSVSPQFDHELYLGPKEPNEIEVLNNGVVVYLDPESASRCDGVTIDYSSGPPEGFSIDNPNTPARIVQFSPKELKHLLDQNTPLVLLDARTQHEADIAKIPGGKLLTLEEFNRVLTLDRQTMIVCYCHHGVRSQAALERLAREGFRKLYNLVGGIDAWSRQIDPQVPRY